jgi:hypothetical protein
MRRAKKSMTWHPNHFTSKDFSPTHLFDIIKCPSSVSTDDTSCIDDVDDFEKHMLMEELEMVKQRDASEMGGYSNSARSSLFLDLPLECSAGSMKCSKDGLSANPSSIGRRTRKSMTWHPTQSSSKHFSATPL